MGLLSAPTDLICIQPRGRPTHEIPSTNRLKESVISPVKSTLVSQKLSEEKRVPGHTLRLSRRFLFRC